MKHVFLTVMVLTMAACAHGKMGQIDQALEPGTITKTTPIYVESISAKNTVFSGDKSADQARVNEEKTAIEQKFGHMIAEALRKKGYNAKAVPAAPKGGVVVTGQVSRFEHGSAAARIMVGMGAGSSNMFTDVKVEDRAKPATLAKFQVIATSGGRGGLAAASSFMDAHFTDGAEKIAEYIAGEAKK